MTPMDELERIDWNEMSRRGLIKRINKEILHPLGLAMTRNVETGQSEFVLVSDDGPFFYSEDAHPWYIHSKACLACGNPEGHGGLQCPVMRPHSTTPPK